MVTFESVLNLKTQGFQGIFRNIVIIFWRRLSLSSCDLRLKQVSKYITLKSTNNILDIA